MSKISLSLTISLLCKNVKERAGKLAALTSSVFHRCPVFDIVFSEGLIASVETKDRTFVKRVQVGHRSLLKFYLEESGMFFLSLIEHTLRLPPHLLSLLLPEAIRGELETIFLDKVIPKFGLCISVYDIRSINGGFIFAGDGSSTYTVDFRLVMFRPFVGEILSGKVEALDANGLQLSLGFFKDILVPVHLLPSPSTFGEDGRWTWEYNGEELPIEKDDEIHFRIHSVTYPSIPVEQEENAKAFAPMVITASIDADGLGPVCWW